MKDWPQRFPYRDLSSRVSGVWRSIPQDLEGLDPLSEGEEDCKEEEEEENPYTLDNEDPPTESVLSPATASPVKKHRKRPRSPTRPLPSRSSTTLPLGQWASDNAEDVDEDEFEHSMSRARRKGAGGNNTARQRPQVSSSRLQCLIGSPTVGTGVKAF